MAEKGTDKYECSLFSLFGVDHPNYGDPDEDFEYQLLHDVPGSPVEGPEGGALTKGRTGKCIRLSLANSSVHLMAHHLWQSAISLADEICCGRVDVGGLNVIELGAGAGLPGIVASRMGAKSVVLSDYPEQCIIDNMEKNIRTNKIDSDSPCVVAGYAWGTPIDKLLSSIPNSAECNSRCFDMVIMADTLWLEDQHHNLLKSCREICKQSNSSSFRVVSMFMNHDNQSQVARRFFELATKEYDFVIEKSCKVAWKKNDQGEDDLDSDSSDPESYGPAYLRVLAPTSNTWNKDLNCS